MPKLPSIYKGEGITDNTNVSGVQSGLSRTPSSTVGRGLEQAGKAINAFAKNYGRNARDNERRLYAIEAQNAKNRAQRSAQDAMYKAVNSNNNNPLGVYENDRNGAYQQMLKDFNVNPDKLTERDLMIINGWNQGGLPVRATVQKLVPEIQYSQRRRLLQIQNGSHYEEYNKNPDSAEYYLGKVYGNIEGARLKDVDKFALREEAGRNFQSGYAKHVSNVDSLIQSSNYAKVLHAAGNLLYTIGPHGNKILEASLEIKFEADRQVAKDRFSTFYDKNSGVGGWRLSDKEKYLDKIDKDYNKLKSRFVNFATDTIKEDKIKNKEFVKNFKNILSRALLISGDPNESETSKWGRKQDLVKDMNALVSRGAKKFDPLGAGKDMANAIMGTGSNGKTGSLYNMGVGAVEALGNGWNFLGDMAKSIHPEMSDIFMSDIKEILTQKQIDELKGAVALDKYEVIKYRKLKLKKDKVTEEETKWLEFVDNNFTKIANEETGELKFRYSNLMQALVHEDQTPLLQELIVRATSNNYEERQKTRKTMKSLKEVFNATNKVTFHNGFNKLIRSKKLNYSDGSTINWINDQTYLSAAEKKHYADQILDPARNYQSDDQRASDATMLRYVKDTVEKQMGLRLASKKGEGNIHFGMHGHALKINRFIERAFNSYKRSLGVKHQKGINENSMSATLQRFFWTPLTESIPSGKLKVAGKVIDISGLIPISGAGRNFSGGRVKSVSNAYSSLTSTLPKDLTDTKAVAAYVRRVTSAYNKKQLSESDYNLAVKLISGDPK